MATYKYDNFLTKLDHEAFDKLHGVGSQVPHSGIYRCHGCGSEIASNEGQPFPPQNHHQHQQSQGAIQWRLITYADHKPK